MVGFLKGILETRPGSQGVVRKPQLFAGVDRDFLCSSMWEQETEDTQRGFEGQMDSSSRVSFMETLGVLQGHRSGK